MHVGVIRFNKTEIRRVLNLYNCRKLPNTLCPDIAESGSCREENVQAAVKARKEQQLTS